ncbi:MAG: hypothetical protein GY928_32805 [Colwellia sp.]|nr:hypothetical protein [Colwellia sp.]
MTFFNTRCSGFSLIESTITLLFFIVGFALVAHFIDRQPTKLEQQQSKARQELRIIENAVGAYTIDLNKPAPSTAMGMTLLVSQGYLSKILLDPWGNPYQYRNPGVYDNIDYWSQGPDGIDSEDDIVGWDPYGSYVR